MSNVRLGAVAGMMSAARGVIVAMRVGRTITVTPESLQAIARDPIRMHDLYRFLNALDDYSRELQAAEIEVT